MHNIISFPALAGMTYPDLEKSGLMRIVAGQAEVCLLSELERSPIRVLMTSASRGCSAETIEALPNLGFVVSQGVGTDLIDLNGLAKRGIKVRSVGEASSQLIHHHQHLVLQHEWFQVLQQDYLLLKVHLHPQ